jgi:hypothetical protein
MENIFTRKKPPIKNVPQSRRSYHRILFSRSSTSSWEDTDIQQSTISVIRNIQFSFGHLFLLLEKNRGDQQESIYTSMIAIFVPFLMGARTVP